MTSKEKVREHLASWTEEQAARALLAAEPPSDGNRNGNGKGAVSSSVSVRRERYPSLVRALRRGQITGSRKPVLERRRVRTIELRDELGEDGQVGFGQVGRPPGNRVRRPRTLGA